MTDDTKTAPKISPKFRKEYPDLARRAAEEGIAIQAAGRSAGQTVYWAEGSYQLTGYSTHADGRPVTSDENKMRIATTINRIAEGRAAVAGMSVEQRFERCLDRLTTLQPRVNQIATDHDWSGDEAMIAHDFGRDLSGQIHLRGVGMVASAKWTLGTELEARRLMRAAFAAWQARQKVNA